MLDINPLFTSLQPISKDQGKIGLQKIKEDQQARILSFLSYRELAICHRVSTLWKSIDYEALPLSRIERLKADIYDNRSYLGKLIDTTGGGIVEVIFKVDMLKGFILSLKYRDTEVEFPRKTSSSNTSVSISIFSQLHFLRSRRKDVFTHLRMIKLKCCENWQILDEDGEAIRKQISDYLCDLTERAEKMVIQQGIDSRMWPIYVDSEIPLPPYPKPKSK